MHSSTCKYHKLKSPFSLFNFTYRSCLSDWFNSFKVIKASGSLYLDGLDFHVKDVFFSFSLPSSPSFALMVIMRLLCNEIHCTFQVQSSFDQYISQIPERTRRPLDLQSRETRIIYSRISGNLFRSQGEYSFTAFSVEKDEENILRKLETLIAWKSF